MIISLSSTLPREIDMLVCFVREGSKAVFADASFSIAYNSIFQQDDRTVLPGKITMLRFPFQGRYIDVLLAGYEEPVSASSFSDAFRSLIRQIGSEISSLDARHIVFDGFHSFKSYYDMALSLLSTELPLCSYKIDPGLCKKRSDSGISVSLLCNEGKCLIDEGIALSEAITIARDLINEPANILTPIEMADRCKNYGKQYGFSVEVLNYEQCLELQMGLFLAVAKGSNEKPAFIIMRYSGAPDSEPPIALVGKGITYDTGGLAIKTGGGMASMRFDMNGGASVVGALCAIASRRLKQNVVGVIAACENMVDAKSYRNGDVYRSMSGTTVFIENTDAEGRLTMADAITYCVKKEKPSEILEVAGLTGSVCNFYGDVCAAVLTQKDNMFTRLVSNYPFSGEKYAQMPYFNEYKKLLKTPFADITNSVKSGPGGIFAGMFLDSFSEGVPFMHIDYGAMPFTSKEGGTGFGVKSLYYYIKSSINKG